MPKKKILVHADLLDLQNAGIRTYLYQFLIHANTFSNYEYVLLLGRQYPEFTQHKQYVFGKWIRMPGWWTIKTFCIIPFLIRKEKVDVFWEPAHFGPIFLGKKHILKVTSIHDLTPIFFPYFHTFRGAYLQNAFLKTILKRTDVILSNSRATTRDLETFLGPTYASKIQTNLLGKDSEMYPDRDTSILEVYDLQEPFFLSVGTIEPRKNHVSIIAGYETYRQQTGTKDLLVLVGSWGWRSGEIQQKIQTSVYADDIRVLGYIPKEHVRKLYSLAKASLYVSHYEGFGFPVVESLQCGCPCIVAKNSSLVEVGGEHVSYVDARDTASICYHLEHVDRALLDSVEKHLALFDWGVHVAGFEQSLGAYL